MQDVVTSEMMEDKSGVSHVMEESQVDVQIKQTKAQPQLADRPNWTNGQCVVAMPSCSMLNPSFDLSLCRAKLENDGFQIPVRDMEAPLQAALGVPSVRRYLVLNSALFHFILAPVLYVVVWCAVFSTLHNLVRDNWVLCLSVSMVSIFLTTAIIFVLHHSNKEINMNVDVRLIQVNERLVKHQLLVAVADWVQSCTGNMQLYFVFWDMSRCLRALTETLEERSSVEDDTQNKMKRNMSHLVLVTEDAAVDPELGGSDAEQDSSEQRPLLRHEDTGCSTSSSQWEGARVSTKYSLVPDASLPAQAKAYQLLMTYSAAYVRLLVSERLSGASNYRPDPRRNHCSDAHLCICQYINNKILR